LELRGIQSPGYSKLQIQQREDHHVAPLSFDESSQSLIFQRVGVGPYQIMLVVPVVVRTPWSMVYGHMVTSKKGTANLRRSDLKKRSKTSRKGCSRHSHSSRGCATDLLSEARGGFDLGCTDCTISLLALTSLDSDLRPPLLRTGPAPTLRKLRLPQHSNILLVVAL
jgi:hypothetical protein